MVKDAQQIVQTIQAAPAESDDNLEEAFLGSTGEISDSSWTTKVQLGFREVTFKLDTGVSVLSVETYKPLQTIPLGRPSKILYDPGRKPPQVSLPKS